MEDDLDPNGRTAQRGAALRSQRPSAKLFRYPQASAASSLHLLHAEFHCRHDFAIIDCEFLPLATFAVPGATHGQHLLAVSRKPDAPGRVHEREVAGSGATGGPVLQDAKHHVPVAQEVVRGVCAQQCQATAPLQPAAVRRSIALSRLEVSGEGVTESEDRFCCPGLHIHSGSFRRRLPRVRRSAGVLGRPHEAAALAEHKLEAGARCRRHGLGLAS
mmetsp:Transcript_46296/g.132002  ORF Transcript_46296/g.132002 Transcript_46296/m.132002 type:complete len:217 (-) Transcript_46296:243-893(-)